MRSRDFIPSSKAWHKARGDRPRDSCIRVSVRRAVAGEKTMRTTFGIIMAIGTWLAASPADAQKYDPRYPVCMHTWTGGPRGGGSDYFDCSFASLEQCRATASGLAATCDVNPYYAGNQPPPPRGRYRPGY
jgi:hypothetical protein